MHWQFLWDLRTQCTYIACSRQKNVLLVENSKHYLELLKKWSRGCNYSHAVPFLLSDRFSISCKRWEPPFLGFCRNLVPWGLLGSYLGVKNIFSLSLLIWAWGHTLYFSLQCKTNPMIVIADFFQTWVVFII